MAHEMTRNGSNHALNKSKDSLPAKAATKHAVEHAPAKHAKKHAKKHAAKHAKKHAAKHAGRSVAGSSAESANHQGSRSAPDDRVARELGRAFAHLNRSTAFLSLLKQEIGAGLRPFLERAVTLYLQAMEFAGDEPAHAGDLAECAAELLRAVEHLASAGIYAQEKPSIPTFPAPETSMDRALIDSIRARVEKLGRGDRELARAIRDAARSLVDRADEARAMRDWHLAYEFLLAADGLAAALNTGVL